MAYQPKSYRKFLAGTTTAAMAAVAVVPAAAQAADVDFPDVEKGEYYEEAVNELVKAGVLEGYEDGTFRPAEQVTRAEIAKIIATQLELETGASSDFTDVSGHWAEEEGYLAAVAEAGIMEGDGGEYGDVFRPNDSLTRAELAAVLVRAFDLSNDDDFESTFTDLDDQDDWAVEAITTLEANKFTDGIGDGEYGPNLPVKRRDAATFIYRVANDIIVEELAITDVSALTKDGRYLEVEFNKPIDSVEKSEVRIFNSRSLARVGIESVDLASDGRSLEIVLYDSGEDTVEIEPLTKYTLQIGSDLEKEFERPAYVDSDDDARIVEVDSDDREIVVEFDAEGTSLKSPVTLEVPEDIDLNFQEALGQEIRVWYNNDEVVENFELQTEDIIYDAIKFDGDEIETIDEGDTYDLDDDVLIIENFGSDDETTYGLDEAKEELDDKEFEYAKVIFNSSGDVERIYAYTLNAEDVILVEEVDGNYIFDYSDEELDLEDYVIVKDGKEITIDDIEQDDLVFFNKDAHGDGYAIVYNETVTGDIDNVYKSSFDLDGENYEYVDGAKYLNEDNEKEELDADGAEKLQEGGEVTAYFNYKGEIVLVKGVEGLVASEFATTFTTDPIVAYKDVRGNQRVEITVVDKDGDKHIHDFDITDLDEIVVQTNEGEVKYEVDKDLPEEAEKEFEIDEFVLGDYVDESDDDAFTTDSLFQEENGDDILEEKKFAIYAKDDADSPDHEFITNINEDATSIGVSTDDKGTITGLKFYDKVSSPDEDIDYDDNYVSGYRLQNDTLVIGIDEKLENQEYPDADDVTFYTWKEIQELGTDLKGATIYYDEDGNITHIVTDDFEAGDTTDYTALIQRVDIDKSDDEITRLIALVDGKSQTYDVDNVDPKSFIKEGALVNLVINDNSGEVTDIEKLDGEETDGFLIENATVKDVNVSKRTVKLETDDGSKTIELEKDGAVYDAQYDKGTDYEVEGLRELEEGDIVSVALVDEESRFASAIVITGEIDEDSDSGEDTDTETYIYEGKFELDDNHYIQLDGETYPYVGTDEDLTDIAEGDEVEVTFTTIRDEKVISEIKKSEEQVVQDALDAVNEADRDSMWDALTALEDAVDSEEFTLDRDFSNDDNDNPEEMNASIGHFVFDNVLHKTDGKFTSVSDVQAAVDDAHDWFKAIRDFAGLVVAENISLAAFENLETAFDNMADTQDVDVSTETEYEVLNNIIAALQADAESEPSFSIEELKEEFYGDGENDGTFDEAIAESDDGQFSRDVIFAGFKAAYDNLTAEDEGGEEGTG